MPRLQKSKDKRDALLSASLKLINEGGIQSASMAKIAKLANVSPATIYLYFENKQDLINSLYLNTKASFCSWTFKDYELDASIKKSFEYIWYNISTYKLENIEEASFLAQCNNSPMVGEEVLKEGLKHLQPLLDLWIRGQREGLIKNISPYLLYAYSIYPLDFLMNTENCPSYQINDDLLKDAFNAAWDSIKM
ncbi:MAG: TetR/AcrR family transcriptional regulator [Marinifilaceae bacterium]